MNYKRLIFKMEKRKLPDSRTGANIYDFSITNEDDKKPLFEFEILEFKDERATRMVAKAFIGALMKWKKKYKKSQSSAFLSEKHLTI